MIADHPSRPVNALLRKGATLDPDPPNLAAQRVERALREFEDSWLGRDRDHRSVERGVDELETAVALWVEAASRDGQRD